MIGAKVTEMIRIDHDNGRKIILYFNDYAIERRIFKKEDIVLNVMFTILFCVIWLTRCAFGHVATKIIHKSTYFHDNYLYKRKKLSKDGSIDNAQDELMIDQNHLNSPDSLRNNNVDSILSPRSEDLLDTVKTEFFPEDHKIPDVATAAMVVKKDAICYNMNHPNRGRCVIFNHEKFDMDLDTRIGTDIDANRIETVFSELGFEVTKKDDLTFAEIKQMLNGLRTENHSNNDCICIFVLTHGHSEGLLCAKDVYYKSDFIWKDFNATLCSSLAGKPKLFFFQACRGRNLQNAVELRSNPEITMTDSVASYKIPTHADFLIAHSTMEGHYSFRNGKKGSCYVQLLCKTIEEYAGTKDLLSMLTITARRVATEFNSYNNDDLKKHNKRQIPSVTSLLTRDLYFTPKTQKT